MGPKGRAGTKVSTCADKGYKQRWFVNFDSEIKIDNPRGLNSLNFRTLPITHPTVSSLSGPSEYEDILQCNNAPSTRTPRGHQIPASFMIVTSGLVKHGVDSASPLPYVHLDIAGSSGPFPGVPTGAPIPTMAKYFMGL